MESMLEKQLEKGEENVENHHLEADIDEDMNFHENDWNFGDSRLVVKPMGTRVWSYQDLVNIDLSTSRESLVAPELYEKDFDTHCMTTSESDSHLLRTENRSILLSQSCPNLTQIDSCDTCDITRGSQDPNESDENITSHDAKPKDCMTFDDNFQSFDCLKFLMLLKSLRLQKDKDRPRSKTIPTDINHNLNAKDTKFSFKLEKIADMQKLQELINKWAKKLTKPYMVNIKPTDLGIEMSDLVGDIHLPKEINFEKHRKTKRNSCISPIFSIY